MMIGIFCSGRHGSVGKLCDDCLDLSEYTMKSLALCPFGAGKPVCGRCPTNCFRSDKHAKMNSVMRYAGPRMLYKHPWLTAVHLFDAIKEIIR